MRHLIMGMAILAWTNGISSSGAQAEPPGLKLNSELPPEAAAKFPEKRAKKYGRAFGAESTKTLAIWKSLRETCSVTATKQPLSELLQTLSKQWDIKVIIDENELAKESLNLDKLVTLKLDKLSRRSVLASVLGAKLGYRVEDDFIVISTRSKCANTLELQTRTYLAGDLAQTEVALDRLSERIRTSVVPDSWAEKGGTGSIRPFDTTKSLIVRQTQDVHQEVTLLLEEMREKAKPRQREVNNRDGDEEPLK